MKLQKINTDNLGRAETGPIQIGDDWPGVFIRGDNALYTAMMLQQAADLLEKYQENDINFNRHDEKMPKFYTNMALTELKNHAKLLSSCNIQLHRD